MGMEGTGGSKGEEGGVREGEGGQQTFRRKASPIAKPPSVKADAAVLTHGNGTAIPAVVTHHCTLAISEAGSDG